MCVDNNIGAITGLQEHKALTHLSLAHNRIEKIENLDSCPLIKTLNLVSEIKVVNKAIKTKTKN